MPKGYPGTRTTHTEESLFDLCLPEPNTGCWYFMGPVNKGGYGTVRMTGRNMNAQRAMWIAVHGTEPSGLDVCHRCDVRLCVNPAHLFLGSRRENLADMDRKGRRRSPRGERNANVKLTADKVRDIWAEIQRGERLIDIAPRYGISHITLSSIKTGRNWRHITETL